MIKLNRFTTIPFLIDMLQRETLTLLNPGFWEDYNDRETVESYRIKTNSKSIYALCLTQGNETVHHWNAFANGTSGCCIEFSPEKLFSFLNESVGVEHGAAEYVSLKNLRGLETSRLPYLKQQPFEPENEYRIIAVSEKEQVAALDIPIDLGVIRRITLSNKLPEPVFDSLKDVLQFINPNLKAKISHSTLFKNSTWINHFRGVRTSQKI